MASSAMVLLAPFKMLTEHVVAKSSPKNTRCFALRFRRRDGTSKPGNRMLRSRAWSSRCMALSLRIELQIERIRSLSNEVFPTYEILEGIRMRRTS